MLAKGFWVHFLNRSDSAGAAFQVAEYLRSRTVFVPPDAVDIHYLKQDELLCQAVELLLRPENEPVQRRTNLLRLGAASQPCLAQEHQVPPTGLHVEKACCHAWGLNRRVALWYKSQRQPAQRAGNNGPQFNQIVGPKRALPAPLLHYVQRHRARASSSARGHREHRHVILPCA